MFNKYRKKNKKIFLIEKFFYILYDLNLKYENNFKQ